MLKDFEDANKGGGTLYNFLQEKFCRTVGTADQVMTTEFSPGLSVHTGSGVVGFVLLAKK